MTEVTIKNYQELALRTEAPCNTVLNRVIGETTCLFNSDAHANIRLIHAALGLTSDVHELVNGTDIVNEIEEVSDACWFSAIGFEALGADITCAFLSDPDTGRQTPNWSRQTYHLKFEQLAAMFADSVKAKVFYGKTVKEGIPMEQYLLGLLRELVYDLRGFSTKFLGLPIEEVMRRNIAKLTARYPERFSEDAAHNRDFEKERAALSGEPVISIAQTLVDKWAGCDSPEALVKMMEADFTNPSLAPHFDAAEALIAAKQERVLPQKLASKWPWGGAAVARGVAALAGGGTSAEFKQMLASMPGFTPRGMTEQTAILDDSTIRPTPALIDAPVDFFGYTRNSAQLKAALAPFEGKTVTEELLAEIAEANAGRLPVTVAIYEQEGYAVVAPFDLTAEEQRLQEDMRDAFDYLRSTCQLDVPFTPSVVASLNDVLEAQGFTTRVGAPEGNTSRLATVPFKPVRAYISVGTSPNEPESHEDRAVNAIAENLQGRGIDVEATPVGVVHALTQLSPETRSEVAQEVKDGLKEENAQS